MKKRLCILICIIICVSTVTYSVFGATVEEVLNNKKNEISTKKDEATNELGGVQGAITTVSEQINELNEKIAKYQQEIAELNKQLANNTINVEKAKAELEKAEKAYIKQKNLLEKRLVATYEGGETVYLDVLLASKGIQDFLSKYYYLLEISKWDKELLNDITENKEKIGIEKANLEKKQEQLRAITNNKEKTATTLENTKAVRNSYLNQLTDQEKKIQADIEQYEKEMAELENEMLKISLESLGGDYAGGEMAWPVPGHRTITSGYGMRIHPVFGVYRMHTGVDIGAPMGANCTVVNDGVVTLAAYSSSYGNYMMVDHGGGVVTLYAHASKLNYSEGDTVKKGDVIMQIGSTGWSTGPHLHFEVRIKGNTVDPLPYITSNKMPSTGGAQSGNSTNENSINEILSN